jgi:uncharacterized membrane protein YidH (DUF202 family)
MMAHPGRQLAGACVFAGPVAWLISTQLNYSLAASLCDPQDTHNHYLAAGLILFSLLGSAVSLVRWIGQPSVLRLEDTDTRIPQKLSAGLGVLLGLLFAAVIALQASALLFLQGCVR